MTAARRVDAVWKQDRLVSPLVGMFRPGLATGDVVRAGNVVGSLEVLGHTVELVAPPGARGLVRDRGSRDARHAVAFDDVLYTVDPDATLGAGTDAADASAHGAIETGLVFAAPTSGRFYGRPSPDKPAFVEAGAVISTGATICLLEVMKTFHRVTYTGEPVKVAKVLVDEGADVNSGDPLLALERV